MLRKLKRMGKPAQKMLTFDERQLIEKYIKKGFSCGETAKTIGRSKNAVVTEVRRGGGEHYSAKIGQNLSDKIQGEKYRKLSERNKSNKVTFKMKQRIENLEMQVEILFETIRGILNDKQNKAI